MQVFKTTCQITYPKTALRKGKTIHGKKSDQEQVEESAESNCKGMNGTDFELLSSLLDWKGSLSLISYKYLHFTSKRS